MHYIWQVYTKNIYFLKLILLKKLPLSLNHLINSLDIASDVFDILYSLNSYRMISIAFIMEHNLG